MTKIITCSELRYRTLDELEALFRTLQIEFGRTAPGSPERGSWWPALKASAAPWRRRASAGSRNPGLRPSERALVGRCSRRPATGCASSLLYGDSSMGLQARTRRGAPRTGSAMSVISWETAPRIRIRANRKRAAMRCWMNWCVRLRAKRPSAIMRLFGIKPAARAARAGGNRGLGMSAAAIYARYSSDLQREASIEDQNRICRERAAREGWPVYDYYSDHGISGASLIRPGIQKLLEDAREGRFQIVVAEALDRMSRDQEDVAALL